MFDFKNWLIEGIVDGYKKSVFSMPHIVTMTANYIIHGMLTEEDAARIHEGCMLWDSEQESLSTTPEEE